ncbi:MAG: MerR family transcriptional regulator [Austwickia sp.]|nr:MerR family transcriptional regulator [Austwickia sp.]
MYSITEVSRLTGVSQQTIRNWEKYYSLVLPVRNAAGHRLYDDSDVKLVAAMGSLVNLGWKPSAAAYEVQTRARDQVSLFDPLSDTVDHSRDDDLIVSFLECAARRDRDGLEAVLAQAWQRHGPDQVGDDWLMPALSRLGAEWEAGRLSVAGEHLASGLIRDRLLTDLDAALLAMSSPVPQVLTGLAQDVHHDLGVVTFSALLARRGIAVRLLGPNVDCDVWEDALVTTGAEQVVLGVIRGVDVIPTARLVGRLHAKFPQVTVHVGGRHQHLVPEPARSLDHHLGRAADAIAFELTLAAALG